MPIKLTRQNCIFTKRFGKQFAKIDRVSQQAIGLKLVEILDEGEKANIKKLTNYPYADFRLKIGNYRILIHRDKKKDLYYLNDCRHRRDLY